MSDTHSSTRGNDHDERPRFEEITCVEFVDLVDEETPSEVVKSAGGASPDADE